MPSFRWLRRVLLAVAVCAGGQVEAQNVQDHQYSSADVEAGSRLYSARCMLCHGPDGDRVSGINLRRGTFRQPMADDDLRRVVTEGMAGKGMPPFALQPAELDALVAFIRAGFDIAGTAVKVGDVERGQTLFDGKGACGTLPSSAREGAAGGAGSERHRRDTLAGRAAAVAARADAAPCCRSTGPCAS